MVPKGGEKIGLRGRGPLGAHFPTPPPPHTPRAPESASILCLGGGGGLRGRPWGEEGSVGTPTYITQNDPHDALIILNIHNKQFFSIKIFCHPSAWGKNKQNWLLDLGSHFLNPAPNPPSWGSRDLPPLPAWASPPPPPPPLANFWSPNSETHLPACPGWPQKSCQRFSGSVTVLPCCCPLTALWGGICLENHYSVGC